MKKTVYDFREATTFLNDCVPLGELYDDVCAVIEAIEVKEVEQ